MKTLSIKGMTCPSCVEHVENALNKVVGVRTVIVSFEESIAEVDVEPQVPAHTILDAVTALGYSVTEIIDDDASCKKTDNARVEHVAIIGSGSAAFACAIKAASAGANVTIIEGADVIGGCCVNVGCVPSKILIRAAQLAHQQRNNPFAGIDNQEPKLHRNLLVRQQSARVDELRGAKYENILSGNPKLSLIKGYASFIDNMTLRVAKTDGSVHELTPDRILIATGSTPIIPNIEGLAQVPYWTSTDALFADEAPDQLIVIGSSVVALEIAQAYRRLGSEVSVLARNTLLTKEEPLLGVHLKQCFEKEGIKVFEHTTATHVSHDGNQFTLNSGELTFQADKLLVCTGRRANTASLSLENTSIETSPEAAVSVNERMQTSVSHIYAAGDCSNMPQYVYVAAAAGSRAGVNMTGGDAVLDLSVVPAVIFTDPQVATVGMTEQQANEKEISTVVRVLEMQNVPRALANFETDGFIKLVAEKNSGRIIGAQILAHEAGEIIQSAALAIRNNMTTTELANQLFPYLTMAEGLKLCAQTFNVDVSQLSCCAG